MSVAPTKLRCPQCGTVFSNSAAANWRPFCSERCKLIDLGEWLDGSRRIAGEPADSTPSGESEKQRS